MAVSLNGDGTITGLSTLDSVTITGLTSLTTTDLTADTTTLVVDSTNNRVGIGTASPSVPLDVNGITRTANAYSLSYPGVPGSTSAFGAGTISADSNWGMYFRAATGAAIADFAWVNGANTERMRITSGGNVGIGTSSPDHVIHAYSSTNGNLLNLQSNVSGSFSQLTVDGSVANTIKLHAGYFDSLELGANDTTQITITSGGNVGIGTSSPSTKLHVSGSGAIFKLDGADGVQTNFVFRKEDTRSVTFPEWTIAHTANNEDFHIYGYDGTTFKSLITYDWSASASIFHSGNTTERMRIDSSGNVGIGLTGPSEMLEVNGNAHFRGTSADAPCLQLGQLSDLSYQALVSMTCDDVGADNFDINLHRYVSDYTWSRSSADGKTMIAKMYSGNGTPRATQFYLYNQDNGASTSTVAVALNTSGNSYFNGGNVGIGTSSPLRPLQVGSYGSGNGEITLASSTTGIGSILFGDGGTGSDIYRGYVQYNHSSDAMLFATSASERMRIDSSGSVCIATTSAPSTTVKLDVAGAIEIGGNKTADNLYVPLTSGTIVLRGSNYAGTPTYTYIGNGTTLGVISSYADSTAAYARFLDISVIGSSSGTGTMRFLTGSTTSNERMRINSSGNVLVGTTSADGIVTVQTNGGNVITAKQTAAGGWCYKSNAFSNGGTYYHIEFLDGGVSHGSVTSNGTSTAYNTSSDYRLKDNVSPMSGSIDRLKQLKPSTWLWVQNGSHGEGFLAHEVQSVVPEAITGTKDAVDDEGNPVYQGIDQAKLVPLLTAALQEAIAKIEDLETRIQALENPS